MITLIWTVLVAAAVTVMVVFSVVASVKYHSMSDCEFRHKGAH